MWDDNTKMDVKEASFFGLHSSLQNRENGICRKVYEVSSHNQELF
jgi:hypothetical protein